MGMERWHGLKLATRRALAAPSALLLGWLSGCGSGAPESMPRERPFALQTAEPSGSSPGALDAAASARPELDRAGPVWNGAPSMAAARASFGSMLLPDGRVLVAGGLSDSFDGPIASAELYDPVTRTWSETGRLNVARSDFTLTEFTLPDGRTGAIAVGGQTADGALASSELYDPASGVWSAGPELPVAVSGHAAARLGDGALLIAGGASGVQTWVLADGAASWAAAGALFAEEPGDTLTSLDDGSAILIGPNPPSAQRYDALAGTWGLTGEPALARAGHSATRLLDGRVLLVGGNTAAAVELYDPSSGSFERTGATSTPHFGHTATRLGDGRVAVVGGVGSGIAGGTELYDPSWGTWSPGPGSRDTRFAHRSELLGDGTLLAIGGIDSAAASPEGAGGSGFFSSADQLDATRAPTTIGEYKLPARLDPTITSSTLTELWASVARPTRLAEGRRYPLLVFLHGNHATCGTGDNPRDDYDCTYTTAGYCPEGFVPVPSHRGYDYIATELAARGFIVVSVNANRGINCGSGEEGDSGFNLARGRLLLSHLRQLSEWHRGLAATPDSLGVSLEGKLDFSQLGMLGHSRGGEGVRAAYQQYRDPGSPWPRRIGEPVNFRALFEIGPVDGQTSQVLDADGTAWNVVLPMCDGDVSDLEGVRPFDRMLGQPSEAREAPKSTFVAWGTNHNYFNTEWQRSDSPGCENHRALFSDGEGITGSAEQRQVGLRSVLTFFLANVGNAYSPALNELFDPTALLESDTRVDRGYTPSLRPNRGITLEDFSGQTGLGARGQPLVARDVNLSHEPVPEHDPSLRAAHVRWFASGGGQPNPADERSLSVPFSARPQGIDLGAYTHLEFRVGRDSADDLLAPSPLLVQLVNADGSLSGSLEAGDFGVQLDGPVGGPYNTHVVLQTARIPLTAFTGATRSALRAVRFVFPDPHAASLFLTSVRASLGTASLSPVQADGRPGRRGVIPLPAPIAAVVDAASASQVVLGARASVAREVNVEGNAVVALRAVEPQRVEVELATARAFQAQDDQLVLDVGNVQSARSRHPGGDLTRVVFTLDARDFAAAPNGTHLLVRYAVSNARQWDFGRLDKSILRP